MTFETANFKEVGGPGNSVEGGQIYSVFSDTDTLGTMVASGYLNTLNETLNPFDFIILSGTDGSRLVQVAGVTSAGVVTVRNTQVFTPEQLTSGDAAVNITTPYTLHSMTAIGNALTLANGKIGQEKVITMASEAGGTDTAILTPTTTLGAYTTITFNDVGQSAHLLFTSAGWAVIGLGGVTLPVVG